VHDRSARTGSRLLHWGHQHGAYIRHLVGSANGQGAVAAEFGNFFRPFGDALAVSDGAGSDWHRIEAPWSSEFPSRHVVLRSDARGDLFALWQESRRLWVAMRPVNAATWQGASLLSETARLFSGRLAVGEGGDALAVWEEQQGTTVGAIRSASSDSWGRPEAIATGRILTLAVGRRGDTLLLEHTAADIRARFRPVASSWQSAEWVASAPQPVSSTSVYFDAAGNAVAIWSADQPAARPRIVSAVRDRRRGWQSSSGESANFARLAVGRSGRSVAVWDFKKPGGYGIHAALRMPGSNRWTAPVELDPSQSGWTPQVGIDSWGRALAIWERRRLVGRAGPLIASDLVDNGPLFTKLQIPKKTSVDARIRFGVAVDRWLVSTVPPPRWRFGDGASARGLGVTHLQAAGHLFDQGHGHGSGRRKALCTTEPHRAPESLSKETDPCRPDSRRRKGARRTQVIGGSHSICATEQLLGHADVSTTANIYVQGSPADLQETLDPRLGRLVRTTVSIEAVSTQLRIRLAAGKVEAAGIEPAQDFLRRFAARPAADGRRLRMSEQSRLVPQCRGVVGGRQHPARTDQRRGIPAPRVRATKRSSGHGRNVRITST
jgi:hypothetical protein